MTLTEKIIGYGVIAIAIAICVFMVIHTIIEIRKLNKETVFVDIIKDGEKVGLITLDKSKLDWIIDTDPIEFTSQEMIEIIINGGNTVPNTVSIAPGNPAT